MSRTRSRPGGRKGGGARGEAGRKDAAVTVRTAGRRKASSTRWLQRQLNDPYVQAAQRDGYRSRAAYKLLEIDDRFGVLKAGQRVLDLGAAPGGWTQVAVKRVLTEGRTDGAVLAVDLLEMDPIPGAEVVQMDFMAEDAPARIRALLGGGVDVVLSDMSPATTGHHNTDHLRIMGLVEAAVVFATEVLRPGGAFVAKVFQGGAEGEALDLLKRHFTRQRHVKPPASRKESPELYVVATGFRGGAET